MYLRDPPHYACGHTPVVDVAPRMRIGGGYANGGAPRRAYVALRGSGFRLGFLIRFVVSVQRLPSKQA